MWGRFVVGALIVLAIAGTIVGAAWWLVGQGKANQAHADAGRIASAYVSAAQTEVDASAGEGQIGLQQAAHTLSQEAGSSVQALEQDGAADAASAGPVPSDLDRDWRAGVERLRQPAG